MLPEELKKVGYAQEEEYFYKLNRELIDRNRRAQDKVRNVLGHDQMKCPKCNGAMKENQVSGINVSRCAQCQGVFFDAPEFDTLMATREHGRFHQLLKKLFEVKKDHPVFF